MSEVVIRRVLHTQFLNVRYTLPIGNFSINLAKLGYPPEGENGL